MIISMQKTYFIMLMLAALVPLTFVSCELNGPLSIYEIVVNDNINYLPPETRNEIAELNQEFATNAREKEYALARFDKICNELQAYYDENRGKLIWDDLNFDISLYNTSNYRGTGEGLLVKSRIITYSWE